jgi:hypothetical protein
MAKEPSQPVFGAAGSQLWESVTDVLVLDAHEQLLLTELLMALIESPQVCLPKIPTCERLSA